MGNTVDKASRQVGSSDMGEVRRGLGGFQSQCRKGGPFPPHFFHQFFKSAVECLNNSSTPSSVRAEVARAVLESLRAIPLQFSHDSAGGRANLDPVFTSTEFTEPCSRFLYPCLVLGLFERDVDLRIAVADCLEGCDEMGLSQRWEGFAKRAIAYARGSLSSRSRLATDTGGRRRLASTDGDAGFDAGMMAESSSGSLLSLDPMAASSSSASSEQLLSVPASHDGGHRVVFDGARAQFVAQVRAVCEEGDRIIASSAAASQSTRESKHVVYFFFNLVKFERADAEVVAAALPSVARAVDLAHRVVPASVFARTMFPTLRSIVARFGAMDSHGAATSALRCASAVLASADGPIRDSAAEEELALALIAASSPSSHPRPSDAAETSAPLSAAAPGSAAQGVPAPSRPGDGAARGGTQRVSFEVRSEAMVTLCVVLGRGYAVSNIAQSALDCILLCHEELAPLALAARCSPADPATSLLTRCTEALELVLRSPAAAAWRGPNYEALVGWCARAAVHFSGKLRRAALRCAARLFHAGKLGFASDVVAVYLWALSDHFRGSVDPAAAPAGLVVAEDPSSPGAVSASASATITERFARGVAEKLASLGSEDGRAELRAAFATLDICAEAADDGWSLARVTVEREFAIVPAQGTVSPSLGPPSPGAPPGASTSDRRGTDGPAVVTNLRERLEDAASGMVDLLSTLALEAQDPRVRQATLGIFGNGVYTVGHPVLGDMFSSASLKLASRLLARQQEREEEIRRLETVVAQRDSAIADRAREAERCAQETVAVRESLRDTEREHEALVSSLSCPICLESFVPRDPAALACGHIFCLECVQLVMRQSGRAPACPQCRAPIREEPRPLKGLG